MALRDAVKPPKGAKLFAEALFKYIYGKAAMKERFEAFAETLDLFPRKQRHRVVVAVFRDAENVIRVRIRREFGFGENRAARWWRLPGRQSGAPPQNGATQPW